MNTLAHMNSRTGRVVLGDFAYSEIRRAIVKGELEPGARLTEVGMAERLDVSRTPIREALRRLESEHLLIRDGASLVVASFDLDAAVELMVIRELLEPQCAETSAPLLNDREVAKLRLLAAEMGLTDDPMARVELNNEFHTLLYSRCPYPRMLSMVDELREHIVTYRLYSVYNEKDLSEAREDHEKLAVLAERVSKGEAEPEAIGRLVADHILRARVALERTGRDAEAQ